MRWRIGLGRGFVSGGMSEWVGEWGSEEVRERVTG